MAFVTRKPRIQKNLGFRRGGGECDTRCRTKKPARTFTGIHILLKVILKTAKDTVKSPPQPPRPGSVPLLVVWSPYCFPERACSRTLPWRSHRLFDVGQKASLGFGLQRGFLGDLGQVCLQRSNLSVLCDVLLQDVLQGFRLNKRIYIYIYMQIHICEQVHQRARRLPSPAHWPSAAGAPAQQICPGSHP